VPGAGFQHQLTSKTYHKSLVRVRVSLGLLNVLCVRATLSRPSIWSQICLVGLCSMFLLRGGILCSCCSSVCGSLKVSWATIIPHQADVQTLGSVVVGVKFYPTCACARVCARILGNAYILNALRTMF
jgi:hypothetical protein